MAVNTVDEYVLEGISQDNVIQYVAVTRFASREIIFSFNRYEEAE